MDGDSFPVPWWRQVGPFQEKHDLESEAKQQNAVAPSIQTDDSSERRILIL